jgi:hypothetical protein
MVLKIFNLAFQIFYIQRNAFSMSLLLLFSCLLFNHHSSDSWEAACRREDVITNTLRDLAWEPIKD